MTNRHNITDVPPDATFPLHISENRRYLVDAHNVPFLYHADTAWRMPQRLRREDVITYLDSRKALGFTGIQVHAINKEIEGATNPYGHQPFHDDDMSRPNEDYWHHLDFVLEEARKRNLFVGLSATWFEACLDGYYNDITLSNARPYGLFLGQRYGRFENIMWILGGDHNPDGKMDAMCVLAAALRETAPHHLLTYHASAEHASAVFFQEHSWFDINMAYTYRVAYKHVLPEYNRTPVKPIILGETGYDGGSIKGFPWSATLVRRQPYFVLLSGACGHATGNASIWHFANDWKEQLNSASAKQMRSLYQLFGSCAWWKLVPDQDHRFVTEGWRTQEDAANAVAAVAEDGSFALVYVPTLRSITVDLSRLRGPIRARWYDPTSGAYHPAQLSQSAPPGSQEIVLDTKNAANDEDWILLLEGCPA